MMRPGPNNQSLRWPHVPDAVREQVEQTVEGLSETLGNDLLAVYVHGSVALGGYRPGRSDIDLLAVSRRPVTPPDSRSLAELLLRLSNARDPLEFHLVATQDLIPWRHPAPFQFHYSEAWRGRFTAALAHPEWHPAFDQPRIDADLAAHVTVARARGLALYGPPPAALLPPVPSRDYLLSILDDLNWALEQIHQDRPYAVFTACRILAYLSTRQILSKDEAASWALMHLPEPSRPIVRQALQERTGHQAAPEAP